MAPLSLVGRRDANGRDALSRRPYRARCRRPPDGRTQASVSKGPDGRTSSRNEKKSAMDAPTTVVPPGQDPASPGRSFALKLRGGETGDSITMFEETVPAGTK